MSWQDPSLLPFPPLPPPHTTPLPLNPSVMGVVTDTLLPTYYPYPNP